MLNQRHHSKAFRLNVASSRFRLTIVLYVIKGHVPPKIDFYCFFQLVNKQLKPGHVIDRLKSSPRKFYGRTEILLNDMKLIFQNNAKHSQLLLSLIRYITLSHETPFIQLHKDMS